MTFDEHTGERGKSSLVFQAAAYDVDGVLEFFTSSDVVGNGIANNLDKALIRRLCTAYLSFNW
ncbi:hypothetical protein [Pseudomonas sp. M5A4_2d]